MNKKLILLIVFFGLSILPIVFSDSAPLNGTITPEQKAQFDAILVPVMTIYNFVKYISSAIAGVFLVVAGITYMSAGSDPKKRENAKHMIGYILLGLGIIWATPWIISLLI